MSLDDRMRTASEWDALKEVFVTQKDHGLLVEQVSRIETTTKGHADDILKILAALGSLGSIVTTNTKTVTENTNDIRWIKKILSPITLISLSLAILEALALILRGH